MRVSILIRDLKLSVGRQHGCCLGLTVQKYGAGVLCRGRTPGALQWSRDSSPGSAAGRQGSGTGTENISWSELGRIRARLACQCSWRVSMTPHSNFSRVVVCHCLLLPVIPWLLYYLLLTSSIPSGWSSHLNIGSTFHPQAWLETALTAHVRHTHVGQNVGDRGWLSL